MFTSQESCLGTSSRKTSSWLVPQQRAVVTVRNAVLKKVIYLHSAHASPKEQHKMNRLLLLISIQAN